MTLSRILLPFYHLVSDEDVPHFAHCVSSYPSVAKFERDLDFFLRWFRPIDLSTLLAHLHEGAALPANPFLLTFDDGYREIFEIVAPILRRKGVPATFFLNTCSLDNKVLTVANKRSLLKHHLIAQGRRASPAYERLRTLTFFDGEELDGLCAEAGLDTASYLARAKPYLTSSQAAELVRHGFTLGSHSADHPPYHLLPLDEQLRQTLESLDELTTRFGLNYRAFAFPGGDTGVSREFFRRVAGRVQVSFGTSAGFADDIACHFQRTGFEYSNDPAPRVLAERYGVELLRRLAGRDIKDRPVAASVHMVDEDGGK